MSSNVTVNPFEETAQPLVGMGDGGGEVVGKADARPLNGCEPTGEHDAVGGERCKIDVAAVCPPDELQRRLPSSVSDGAHLVDRAVKRADPFEPPEDVHAPRVARHP